MTTWKLFHTSVLLLIFTISDAQIVDKKITHTVKSGETLHSITRQYLGTDILWQENWKLNPQVQNPNLLSIGQKLTIIKQRIIPAEKATMIEVVNHVEIKTPKEDWKKASLGDELKQKEGVRTYDESSALLRFNDESELKILAFSQVFLQSRKTTLSGTDSATIEITKGDAELLWEPLKTGYSDITLISGTTTLKPSIEKGETASLRAGITKQGNSIVSMYKGKSNIESAGSSIAIPQGMGVRVKPGQIPPKPKPLLKAPLIENKTANYNYSNPILQWNKVNHAHNYLVEVCQDVQCNSIFMQYFTPQTQLQLQHLKRKGTFYWRVSAISSDEIVGYKSQTSKLSTTQAINDENPPVIALKIIGQHAIEAELITLAPTAKLSIKVYDELSGVKLSQYKFDNNSWLNVTNNPIDLPELNNTLHIRSTDNLGQKSSVTYRIKY